MYRDVFFPSSKLNEQPDLVSLAAAVEARFRASPFLPLRSLKCEENRGQIVIRGRVPTRYLQQLACSLVGSAAGWRRVASEVEVTPPGSGPPPSFGAAG